MDPDDTKPTAYWDNALGKYVVSVRRDLTPDWYRTIGRCVTSNLSDWQSELNSSETGCPVVFALDSKDPVCHTAGNCPGGMDIYTNAWTPYPSAESPAVHLFFPSMYCELLQLYHRVSSPAAHIHINCVVFVIPSPF